MIQKLRGWWDSFSRGIGVKLGFLEPNFISFLNLVCGLVAGFLIYRGNLFLAGVFVLLSGLLDLIDGAVARATGKKSRFGAIFDASMDRLSEGFVYLGAAVRYPVEAVLALIFSYMVSYVRAKDDRIKVGIATRGDRVVMLGVLLIFGLLREALLIVAFLSFLTFLQRLLHARRLYSQLTP